MSDSRISAQAAAAREAARQASGEFGVQAHTAPAPDPAVGGAAPPRVFVPGGTRPIGTSEIASCWPIEGSTLPETNWEYSDSGGIDVDLDWEDRDGRACSYTVGRGPGEYDETYDSFDFGLEDGDPLADLDERERQALRDYGRLLQQDAQYLVETFEAQASLRPDARAAIARALTPGPHWTSREIARNESDLHLVDAASDETALAADLVRRVRDRGGVSIEDVQALTGDDLRDLDAEVGGLVAEFVRARRGR